MPWQPKTKFVYSPEFASMTATEILKDIDVGSGLLNLTAERHLFRRFNYYRWRMYGVGDAPQNYAELAIADRNLLIERNIKSAYSLADKIMVFKKMLPCDNNFQLCLSDMYMVLLNCVNAFDYYKSNRFSTYFYNAAYRSNGGNGNKSTRDWKAKSCPNNCGWAEGMFYKLAEANYNKETESHSATIAIREVISKLPKSDLQFINSLYGLDGQEELSTYELARRKKTTRRAVQYRKAGILVKLRELIGPAA